MTKKEREALQSFMNQSKAIREDQDRAFKELQDMSRENGLPVWCSAKANARQLEEIGNGRADTLYEKYLTLGAQYDMLNSYGAMLAGLDFWK